MSSTQVLCLGDIADFINGDRGKNYPSTKDYLSEGIPFFSASDLEGRRVDLSSANFISEDAYNRLGNGKTLEGDILFCLRGSLGKIGLAKGIGRGAIASSLVIVRPKEGFFRDYIYYLLSGPSGKTIAQELDNGSVQGNLSVRELKKVEVNVPPIAIQNGIVNILGTLDDKIELNRKTNETLEGIAKALFKSWFVDFDPVRAKAEGRPTGLPDEVSELFPDSFEDSELGEIPIGWSVRSIGELMTLERDSITPGETPEEIFDHYSIPAFDEGMVPAAESGESIKSSKYLISDSVFMISKLNPRSPRVWIPASAGKRRKICSTEFLVCRPKAPIGMPFAYHLSKSGSIAQRMSDMASGTSNSHQRVRPVDFTSLSTVRPADHLLDLFTNQISPLLRRSLVIREENQVLAQCRDALLPKLISGELRVPDAEKMLEEVGI